MKKIIIIVVISFMFLVGCGINSKTNAIDEIINKYKKSSGYMLSGILEITNNDEVYNYDVEVGYEKDNNYKVELTNKSNEYTQIILKNSDGVYVLTPALNKSFKFHSDWPYDNSQIYLYDAIINDMKKDDNLEFEEKDNEYIFNTSVKYPNNNRLVKQKIIFNKDFKLNKVSVYDKNGTISMSMKFDKIKFSPKFSDDYFSLDNYVVSDENEEKENNKTSETSSLDDIIYPLFIPSGTKLISEDRVNKDSGERVIMTYDGEKSFVLVEETVDVFDEFTVIPSYGEPYQLMDTLGVLTDNSLSWISGNTEYYLISDVMSKDELLEVAQSLVGVISMK